MPLLERSALSIPVARAVLPSVQHDLLLHAGTALMLLVGLRPGEVGRLTVADYEPGPEAWLTVDGDHRIRIAPSAAASLDAYLGGQDAELDEPLLLGFEREHGDMMRRVFTRETEKARLHVSMHDLRQVAMTAALDRGGPGRRLRRRDGPHPRGRLRRLTDSKPAPVSSGGGLLHVRNLALSYAYRRPGLRVYGVATGPSRAGAPPGLPTGGPSRVRLPPLRPAPSTLRAPALVDPVGRLRAVVQVGVAALHQRLVQLGPEPRIDPREAVHLGRRDLQDQARLAEGPARA